MKVLIWIAAGSALGGSLRFGMDELVALCFGTTFPVSTLIVNLLGSFVIGFLAGRWAAEDAKRPEAHHWHFWTTGVCGGFTTFSSFSWQVLEMVQTGEGQIAGLYAAGSVGFGLMAVWLGLSLGMRKRVEM